MTRGEGLWGGFCFPKSLLGQGRWEGERQIPRRRENRAMGPTVGFSTGCRGAGAGRRKGDKPSSLYSASPRAAREIKPHSVGSGVCFPLSPFRGLPRVQPQLPAPQSSSFLPQPGQSPLPIYRASGGIITGSLFFFFFPALLMSRAILGPSSSECPCV